MQQTAVAFYHRAGQLPEDEGQDLKIFRHVRYIPTQRMGLQDGMKCFLKVAGNKRMKKERKSRRMKLVHRETAKIKQG